MDTSLLVKGAYIEIKLSPIKEFKGLWKIVDIETINDGDEDFYRIKIDKNEAIAGDEIFAEYYPSMEKQLCLFKTFTEFPLDKAKSWPPPVNIMIDDIEYCTMMSEATDDDHTPFKGTKSDGTEYEHWEYEDEKATNVLQVILVNDYVVMYSGCVVNTGFIELT